MGTNDDQLMSLAEGRARLAGATTIHFEELAAALTGMLRDARR